MTRFRSKSEKITNDFLKDKKVLFKFEPYFIKYIWIENKKYLPDFVLDNGIVLEVKGRFTLDDRKKLVPHAVLAMTKSICVKQQELI